MNDIRKSLGDHMKAHKEETEKETIEKHQSLTHAKDRAQVTAATAMSIVNVAMLKNVMDRGPDDNRFYLVNVVLISTTLALQVLAGLLSIVIEQMLGYFSKHRKNVCEDFKENCCFVRCIKKHNGDERAVSSSDPLFDPWDLSTWEDESVIPMDDNEGPLCSCCPGTCTTEVYSHHDLIALKKYYRWKTESLDNELKSIKAQEELEYRKAVIEQAPKTIVILSNDLKQPGIEQENMEKIKQQIKDLRDSLDEAEKSKDDYEEKLRKADILREQGDFVKQYAETLLKNRILKLVAFWQQVLNVIFYIVFVLNAFITGFGFSPLSAAAPYASTSDVTTTVST